MRTVIAFLLIALTALRVAAQTPAPGPIDLPTLYSHLLYIEGRLNTIETQARENNTAELAKIHEVHELIIVQAEKPNPIVGLLTNEKFWTFVSATVAAIAVIWQQKSK